MGYKTILAKGEARKVEGIPLRGAKRREEYTLTGQLFLGEAKKKNITQPGI